MKKIASSEPNSRTQNSLKKKRIDQILVESNLVVSRKRAQALIMAGKVIVNDQRVEKASQLYFPDKIDIRLKQKDHPYVSRGALKLEGAIKNLDIDVNGMVCLDIGSSTGGFTDYLLRSGAQRVYAFDCGTGQLHESLRSDPRVILHENFNVRFLKEKDIPEKIDLIVIDVSFISLKLIIPPIITSVPPPWKMLALIKPQFEAGKKDVSKGGIVRNAEIHLNVLNDLKGFFTSQNLEILADLPATIQGTRGNQEYFLFSKTK
ncbi:MAG: TlyA family RNA methyltransferase [Deltaproteobacteria bacterium]|nr:TlyA family RNA methyltransferase [Deltaproteobacteria bacterium]